MALSAPNRKLVRERLAALITSEITDFNAVYDHTPRDLDGDSPVATISSLGFSRGNRPYNYDYQFLVGVWVRRDLSTGVSAAEDTLDSLMQQVAQLFVDYAADSILQSVRIEDTTFSQTAYPVANGIPYRAEFIPVTIRPRMVVS